MNKQQIIDDITSKAIRVVSISEELDEVKNLAGVRMYIANVIEQKSDTYSVSNKGFYVVDEGTAQESAYYRERVADKNVVLDAAVGYVNALIPATYLKVIIDEASVDEQNLLAEATAYKDNGDGTCAKMKLFVFKNGENPIAHREIK